MKRSLTCLLLLALSLPALAATNKDHWHKVESTNKKKETKTKPLYPYDSVESDMKKQHFSEIGFWSLRPKMSLSFGFHADKSFFKNSNSDRFFLDSKVYFLNQPWHRITANFQVLQRDSAFIGATWEYTPQRSSARNYYGLGVAHLLISKKEFSNLVEADAYYLTANIGREFLLKSGRAWFLETKAFWSGNNYALQLAAGYIIPF